ncbi:MAG: glycogen synthase [Candidatus Kapaibacteriales bacterium]
MNILVGTAELNPFAKVGGLADITNYLSIEWEKFGQSTIVVLPKYQFINTDKWGFQPTSLILYVPISNWIEFARLWVGKLPESNVPVYLIENQDYFNRPGIYGEVNEYPDNDRRFIFFSRAILETAKVLNFKPDILHCHDYHTSFALAFLKSQYRYDLNFATTAGVFTIHNLAYQGIFDPLRAMEFSTFGIKEFYPGSWFEHNGKVNSMKVGIMFADKITTVSPNYAKEIRYSYFGEGLHDVLNLRGSDLIGILNGVQYTHWDPETDKFIPYRFSINNLDEGKRLNKYHLLKEFNIPSELNWDLPIICSITRLVEQKGIDLIINKIEYYLSNNHIRLALLGAGEKRYEDFFHYIRWKYPNNSLVYIGYNEELSHKIIAGSDYILLPSRFEPCGLTQMFGLRYGTIPIARLTGGFVDTVEEYNLNTGVGDGFTFYQYNADDMAYAIRRALDIYHIEPHWTIIRKNAMQKDFSSEKTALEYLKVFNWAIEKVRKFN